MSLCLAYKSIFQVLSLLSSLSLSLLLLLLSLISSSLSSFILWCIFLIISFYIRTKFFLFILYYFVIFLISLILISSLLCVSQSLGKSRLCTWLFVCVCVVHVSFLVNYAHLYFILLLLNFYSAIHHIISQFLIDVMQLKL